MKVASGLLLATQKIFFLLNNFRLCFDQQKIKVAAGIQMTTLRYFTSVPEHSWLTLVIDFFDVMDYAVEGYIPMQVITEMHFHLWDMILDYRPVNFDYRIIVSAGTFIVSSNISTASSGITLRFIIEDCTLSLAPYKRSTDNKKRNNTVISALPASELVCVLDLELFEISLRLNDKATASFPKFDLRTTINGVYLRTCSDSAEVLAKFITYVASEGDLVGQTNESDENEMQSNEELLSTKATRPRQEITATQHERIKSLMAEAMQESVQLVPGKFKSLVVLFALRSKTFFFVYLNQKCQMSRTMMIRTIQFSTSRMKRYNILSRIATMIHTVNPILQRFDEAFR